MRWTQRDPLDQTGDLRQGNAYSYAGADPVGFSDLEGEWVPLAVGAVRLAATAAPHVGRMVARGTVQTTRGATTSTRAGSTRQTGQQVLRYKQGPDGKPSFQREAQAMRSEMVKQAGDKLSDWIQPGRGDVGP